MTMPGIITKVYPVIIPIVINESKRKNSPIFFRYFALNISVTDVELPLLIETIIPRKPIVVPTFK